MNPRRMNAVALAALVGAVASEEPYKPSPAPDARNPRKGTQQRELKPAIIAKETRQLRRARERAERKAQGAA